MSVRLLGGARADVRIGVRRLRIVCHMARRPVSPRVNAKDPPPLWELGAQAFEELCCDVLDLEPEVSRCELFGNPGQRQRGIDLKAWLEGDARIDVAQCKACRRVQPAHIRDAGREFLEHWDYWQSRRIRRFILIIACDLRSSQCHDAVDKTEGEFKGLGLNFEAWFS